MARSFAVSLNRKATRELFEAEQQRKKLEFLSNVFNYLKRNALGQPEGKFLDSERKSGRQEPGIYAEPRNEMLMGEVDAFHGGSVMKAFKMSKVGSGEGVQAFGYGGYFSSRKGVAESYRRGYERKYGGGALVDLDVEKFKKLVGDEVEEVLSPQQAAEFLNSKHFEKAVGNIEGTIKRFGNERAREKIINDSVKREMKWAFEDAQHARSHMDDTYASLVRILKINFGGLGWDLSAGKRADLAVYKSSSIADRLTKKILNRKPSAALYKAKIWEGRKENLVDWDIPVDPDKLYAIRKQAEREGVDLSVLDDLNPEAGYTGSEIYNELATQLGYLNRSKTGKYNLNAPKAASEFLNRAGIDGIRYPVGTLSGGGKGYNYVVFDEKAIKLKRIK